MNHKYHEVVKYPTFKAWFKGVPLILSSSVPNGRLRTRGLFHCKTDVPVARKGLFCEAVKL